MTGDVYAASCDGGQTTALGHTRLNADQLAQVYDRVDRFQGVEYEQTDPATADAMTIRLIFSGVGSGTASTVEQQEILDFAAELFTMVAEAPTE